MTNGLRLSDAFQSILIAAPLAALSGSFVFGIANGSFTSPDTGVGEILLSFLLAVVGVSLLAIIPCAVGMIMGPVPLALLVSKSVKSEFYLTASIAASLIVCAALAGLSALAGWTTFDMRYGFAFSTFGILLILCLSSGISYWFVVRNLIMPLHAD